MLTVLEGQVNILKCKESEIRLENYNAQVCALLFVINLAIHTKVKYRSLLIDAKSQHNFIFQITKNGSSQ